MSSKVFPVVLLLALALSACASEKLIGRPDMGVVTNGALPPPGKGDLLLQQRSYFVGPLDKVAVEVYGVQELSRTVQVDAAE